MFRFIVSLMILSSVLACTNVEQSAENVFSNANDALKPENNSIWWENKDQSQEEEKTTEQK